MARRRPVCPAPVPFRHRHRRLYGRTALGLRPSHSPRAAGRAGNEEPAYRQINFMPTTNQLPKGENSRAQCGVRSARGCPRFFEGLGDALG